MINNTILWTDKYKPKHISDIVCNSDKIPLITEWLKNYKNLNICESKSKISANILLISGDSGIGKFTLINLLLESLNYKVNMLTTQDLKNKNYIFNILKNDKIYQLLNEPKKNNVIVINNLETTLLTNEKNVLLEICKSNNKLIPIIFITTNKHNKFIITIKKIAYEIKFHTPTLNEFSTLIKNIIKKENIKIYTNDVIITIIKQSQYDIIKLLHILQDIHLTYKNDVITINNIQLFFSIYKDKDINTGLYNTTHELFNNYTSIQRCIEVYDTEKVLLPLMIYENYHKVILNNKNELLNQLDNARNICESLSKGDIIETNIYIDQNWNNQFIHCFYSICDTSFLLYNNKNKSNLNLDFSVDLNKTSLKNINKKNIQVLLVNFKIEEILFLNKILYSLILKNNISKICKICKEYNIDFKKLEIIIKINKVSEKLLINTKLKKYLRDNS